MKPIPIQTVITASMSGKISDGEFGNENPFFSIQQTLQGPMTLEETREMEQELYGLCLSLYKQREQQAYADRIRKVRKDLRFYVDPETKTQVPSVSSILNWDADFYVSPEELMQYAAQGSITHLQVAKYWETGEWIAPKEIKEAYPYLVTMKRGGLKLTTNGVDFKGFLEKYPFKALSWEKPVLNMEHRYGGTYDFVAEDKDGIVTLCDVKRTADPVKNFAQMAAYAKCLPDVKQLCIIVLNDKTKQGWSKPTFTGDIDLHFQYFLQQRRAFRDSFGL